MDNVMCFTPRVLCQSYRQATYLSLPRGTPSVWLSDSLTLSFFFLRVSVLFFVMFLFVHMAPPTHPVVPFLLNKVINTRRVLSFSRLKKCYVRSSAEFFFFTFLFVHRVSSCWCISLRVVITIHALDTPPRFLCLAKFYPYCTTKKGKKGKGNKVWRDARTEIFQTCRVTKHQHTHTRAKRERKDRARTCSGVRTITYSQMRRRSLKRETERETESEWVSERETKASKGRCPKLNLSASLIDGEQRKMRLVCYL